MFEQTEPPFDGDDNEYGAEYDDSAVLPDPELEAAAAAALDDFEQALEVARLDDLDADATLAEAAQTKVAERRAQARQVWLAAHWADLHAVLAHPTRTTPGCERLIGLGGDGTPHVAEFAPAEFGVLLGISDTAAHALIGDALDLRHRFPRLWAQVQSAGVDVWMARKTVQQTRGLSKQAAGRVDERIAGLPGTLTWPRLRRIVQAAMLAADPPKAISEAERAASEAGVRVDDDIDHGYATMIIKAAAGDIAALHEALGLIADALHTLGDTSTRDQRLAAAAGIIANPQTAQDLLAQADAARQTRSQAAGQTGDVEPAAQPETTHPDAATPTGPGSTGTGPSGFGSGSTAAASGSAGFGKPLVWNRAVLYYHLSKDTLDAILAGAPDAGAGMVRVEDIGPVIADQVQQWLGHTNVVVKPVIDLAGIPPVDHYEVTPSMSEAIGLIRAADTFPHGTCTSRHQDNDHTVPYIPMDEGGPPGQTDPLKMTKLTRGHHRIKTFGGWTVHQVRPGAWQWRSPHGYHFLVDQHGTTHLGKLE